MALSSFLSLDSRSSTPGPHCKNGNGVRYYWYVGVIAGFWGDSTYTYDHGQWLIATSMAPGIIIGLLSAFMVEIAGLPELVGAYNGFGGFAACLEGIGLYLDPVYP